MLEAPVYVITKEEGFMRIKSHQNLLSSRVEMVDEGIIDELPKKTFRIMVGNLSKKPIHLPKRTYVGVGVDVPNRIVSFSGEPEE